MIKQLYKSIFFVLSVHVLSVINMLLICNHTVTDTVGFVCLIALCILLIPIYFVVKNDPPRKWIYMLCSFASHIVFTLLVCFILGSIFKGWDTVIIYLTEIFLSSAFGIVFVIDCIVNFRS